MDKTGAVWDCEVGERIKKLKGHSSFVNTCCPVRRGVPIVATGSDDGNIKVSMCAWPIVLLYTHELIVYVTVEKGLITQNIIF